MSADLSTTYLGLKLRSPLVASASPLSGKMDSLRRMEAAGAGAVVMQSLFEEQIEHEELQLHAALEAGTQSYAEALTYLPELDDYNSGPRAYLAHLEATKRALSIPVIASLNGYSAGGWTRYARLMQESGADALELNAYFVAADPDWDAADVEARYLELVAGVRAAISIPLAVKISPYFSSPANMARRLVEAGADGLVLFNRFLHPDIDLGRLEVVPALSLSTSEELRLPLRWIAILKGRLPASLAGTGGVHSAADALKLLLAGADVAMLASALLLHQPEHLGVMLDGLRAWLDERDYVSVEQLKGSLSQLNCPDPAAFERANYMRALVNYTRTRT